MTVPAPARRAAVRLASARRRTSSASTSSLSEAIPAAAVRPVIPSVGTAASSRAAAVSAVVTGPVSTTAHSPGPDLPRKSSPRSAPASRVVTRARVLCAVGQPSSRRSRPMTISAWGGPPATDSCSARWPRTALRDGRRAVASATAAPGAAATVGVFGAVVMGRVSAVRAAVLRSGQRCVPHPGDACHADGWFPAPARPSGASAAGGRGPGAEAGGELHGHRLVLLVELGVAGPLHGLGDVGEPSGLPPRHRHQPVVELAGGVDRVLHLGLGAPPLGATLLEEAEGVPVAVVEIAQSRLLLGGRQGDDDGAVGQAAVTPDLSDDRGVPHLLLGHGDPGARQGAGTVGRTVGGRRLVPGVPGHADQRRGDEERDGPPIRDERAERAAGALLRRPAGRWPAAARAPSGGA